MSRIPARSPYVFALIAGCLIYILFALTWSHSWVLEQRTTHWAVGRPYILVYLLNLVLVGIGGIAAIGLSLTEIVDRSDSWRKHMFVVAIVSAAANSSHAFIYLGERGWYVLYRDIVFSAVFAALIVAVMGWLARRLSRSGASSLRLITVCLLTLVFLANISLLGLFVVHCTSGDCL